MKVQFNPISTSMQGSKPEKKRNIAKSIGAQLLSGTTVLATHILSGVVSEGVAKYNSSEVLRKHKNQFKDSAFKTLDASGLNDKGVQIIYHPTEKIPRPFFEYLFPDALKDLKRGKQAFFSVTECKMPLLDMKIPANSVNLPEGGMYTSFAHELGHAMNIFGSKFSRFISQLSFRQYPSRVAAISLFLSSFTSKRIVPEGQELSKKDKIINSVRNNAYTLPLIAGLPMLMDEGLASLKGEKYSKPFLSKELRRKMQVSNRLAFSAYLLYVGAYGVGVFCAPRIKDKMVERDRIKSLKNNGAE